MASVSGPKVRATVGVCPAGKFHSLTVLSCARSDCLCAVAVICNCIRSAGMSLYTLENRYVVEARVLIVAGRDKGAIITKEHD